MDVFTDSFENSEIKLTMIQSMFLHLIWIKNLFIKLNVLKTSFLKR